MTDEEIKKLAKEYAESVCPAGGYDDKEQRDNDRRVEYDFALPVLRWLDKDYCIVPKNEVKEHYRVLNDYLPDKVTYPNDFYRHVGAMSVLCMLFGKELFQDKTQE